MSEKYELLDVRPPTPQNWGTFNPFFAQNPPILGGLGGGLDGNAPSQTSSIG
jgi:hypothetical protein